VLFRVFGQALDMKFSIDPFLTRCYSSSFFH